MRGLSRHAILVQRVHEGLVLRVVCLDRLLPSFTSPVFGNFVEDFDLIVGGFEVVLCALLHLNGHIGVEFEVLGQPYCREMAPSQLLNDDIAIKQDLANMYGMVSTNFVVRHSLIFT